MNNTPSTGFWGGLLSLGSVATGLIGAIKGPPNPAAAPVAAPTNWLPFALIGGGVLLVIGLFLALRK